MIRVFLLAFLVSASAFAAVPRQCASVVKACRAGGFIPGKKNRRPGKGLWTDCVRPISKGKTVKGVVGVSKKTAQACLKARRPS